MITDTAELGDITGIFRRRIILFIIPALVISAVTLVIALVWPPTYKSKAVILLEDAEIDRRLVSSAVAVEAKNRINIISERVTTNQNLINIIDKYELYQDLRGIIPLTNLVDQMRDKINLELISTEESARRAKSESIIAFRLSFDDRKPDNAQKVVSDLVSLFLSADLRERQGKASDTSEFLSSEVGKLEEQISALDLQIGELEKKYSGSLPKDAANSMVEFRQTQSNLNELKTQAEILKEKMSIMRDTPPEFQNANGKSPKSTYGNILVQLNSLRAEYTKSSATFRPSHPTMVRLKNEIDHLEEQIAKLNEPSVTGKNGEMPAGSGNKSGATAFASPEYEKAAAELRAVEKRIAMVEPELSDIRLRMQLAPQVEQQLGGLLRKREGLVARQATIREKLLTAELGESVEANRKGERFSLREPPSLPSQPVSPNRLLILVFGAVLAAGSGISAVMLREISDTTVHSANQLLSVSGAAPLAVIPLIETAHDRRRRRVGMSLAVGSTFAMVLGLLVAIHVFVTPLDLLWHRIERNIAVILAPITT